MMLSDESCKMPHYFAVSPPGIVKQCVLGSRGERDYGRKRRFVFRRVPPKENGSAPQSGKVFEPILSLNQQVLMTIGG
jgi:hypothetical protein